ncbi:hypothetical protein PF002_g11059 [Phytophthora fragariae]|uniref:Uncharacterized protein n=2 Tax=Phytophthora fragariae TaxID=53985 RepID=A0A6A3F0B1_9STRA|nr:hypothetical protein PF003_g3221 [Phytophthora fragariae]KAE8939165.1 hypothetical protein PF009_g10980 [Phytophthora fragariae]KAE8953474.1 hypothetical protein PF011_g32399 [Phytophthora fragariae]KAE9149247.1 hypothetical protein PF006_g6244 [Phytophthora fragariae]KAE9237045.1 hypothetical protein PF002_g11059 [Phytophthora fragariae]
MSALVAFPMSATSCSPGSHLPVACRWPVWLAATASSCTASSVVSTQEIIIWSHIICDSI